jgi:hypothetical protein
MQRRALNAARKAGLSATPSARALIILLPIVESLAQAGTRPQRTPTSSRVVEPSAWRTIRSPPPGLLRTTGTACVGAILNRGARSREGSENSATPKERSIRRLSARRR